MRGGGFGSSSRSIRIAYRGDRTQPNSRENKLGFRAAIIPLASLGEFASSVYDVERPADHPLQEAPADPAPTNEATTDTTQATAPPQPSAESAEPSPAPAEPTPRTPADGPEPGEAREFGGIEMLWCPPGDFAMGNYDSGSYSSRRVPKLMVRLTKGFWIAKTECTQAQWTEVMDRNPSRYKGESLPVERVSWPDAQAWMERMNQLRPGPEGWRWSLPTEAQWEYAARSFTSEPFVATEANAWYFSTSLGSGRQSNPVATKLPNAIGLYDMLGNVMEWCLDRYGDYPRTPVIDPSGAPFGNDRVHRGGSWKLDSRDLRAGARSYRPPSFRSDELGFRAVLVPVD